jgi:hypothetical protein
MEKNQFDPNTLMKNKKFVETVKTFAIYGAVLYFIEVLAGMLLDSLRFSYGYYSSINIFALVYALIVGAIGLGIAAIIFYFIYEPVRNWVKKTPFLAKHINSLFTLLWKPYLVIIILSALIEFLHLAGYMGMAGPYGAYAYGFGSVFIGWIVFLAIEIGAYYWFAKMVSAKLGHYYPW